MNRLSQGGISHEQKRKRRNNSRVAWPRNDCGPRHCAVAATGTGHCRRHLAERRRTVQRLLRLEDASYTLEGLVATGVFFILLALIVQVGFLILARSAAATSLEASLRRGVVLEVDSEILAERIARDVVAVVPGASDVLVRVVRSESEIEAIVEFRWIPPGPDLVPVTVTVTRRVVSVIPP